MEATSSAETEMAESMEIDSEAAVDTTKTTTTKRAEDVAMEDATSNIERKKKNKSKKKKKKKKTTDDGVIQGGRMVEGTDSSNETASTQGVRAGTDHNIYNSRTSDVPIEHYCSEEAIAEGIQAQAEFDAEQEARSTTTTTPTTDDDNSGDGHKLSGDDGICDGGPGRDRDRDQGNDPQASMEAVLTATVSASLETATPNATTIITTTSNGGYLEWFQTGCLSFDSKQIKDKIDFDEHTGELVGFSQ